MNTKWRIAVVAWCICLALACRPARTRVPDIDAAQITAGAEGEKHLALLDGVSMTNVARSIRDHYAKHGSGEFFDPVPTGFNHGHLSMGVLRTVIGCRAFSLDQSSTKTPAAEIDLLSGCADLVDMAAGFPLPAPDQVPDRKGFSDAYLMEEFSLWVFVIETCDRMGSSMEKLRPDSVPEHRWEAIAADVGSLDRLCSGNVKSTQPRDVPTSQKHNRADYNRTIPKVRKLARLVKEDFESLIERDAGAGG